MNGRKEDLLLYAVTDRRWLQGYTLYEQVCEVLQGGITMLQLREKKMAELEFLEEAVRMKRLCDQYHVPLIINDHPGIAKKAGADGVHIGQKDQDLCSTRALLGPDKIIGVSARTVEQAMLAQEQGADYLGVGAVFETGTKQDAQVIPLERLAEICQSVTIPVVAIGGITRENMGRLEGSGISGVAVVSAVFAQKNIRQSVRQLKEQVTQIIPQAGNGCSLAMSAPKDAGEQYHGRSEWL